MTEAQIAQLLWFGYLVEAPGNPLPSLPTAAERKELEGLGLDALARLGAERWRSAVAKTVPQDGVVVIPLSGGLDSRSILAAVLELRGPGSIVTYTAGVPDALDFQIGSEIARRCGTTHYSFNLSEYPYSREGLLDVARRARSPVPLLGHAPVRWIEEQIGRDGVHLSGFMGDPLSGSHLLRRDSPTWGAAVQHFWLRNRFGLNRYAHTLQITPRAYSPASSLPKEPFFDKRLLGYDEQLDFFVRQQGYIGALLFLKGFEYRTPFLHPDWASFMLGVPRRFREGQRLYKRIMLTAFPEVFSLPTTTHWGLPLTAPGWRIRARYVRVGFRELLRRWIPGARFRTFPNTRYADFDEWIRCREDLQCLVGESLQRLKQREVVPWIDVDGIWNSHLRRRANHGKVLDLLTSLEIHLEIEEERVRSEGLEQTAYRKGCELA